MALICAEHGDGIRVGEQIFCVSNEDVTAAICERALQEIPVDERYKESFPDGVNIHAGSSIPNADGVELSFVNFKREERLFTVTLTALRKYLPAVAAQLFR